MNNSSGAALFTRQALQYSTAVHRMRTLRQEGVRKVLAGVTTADEVLRVTQAGANFAELASVAS